MRRKYGLILGVFCLGQVFAATTVSCTTPEFRLSIKQDGIRASAGEESLRYSNLWDGDADATVTIRQDGAVLAEGLTGEGEQLWSVTRNGTYALTHTTYTNGVVAKVLNATFVVEGLDIPFPMEGEGAVSVAGYDAAYDGAGHGISVTAPGISDLQVRYALSATGPFTAEPPVFTNAVAATTVWCELVAPGYIPQTNSATVAIAPLAVTVTSANKSKKYDGTPLALTEGDIAVSGGLPAGESFAYSGLSSRTAVGESSAAFTVEAGVNTLLSNYAITKVEGKLTVTKAGMGGGEGGADEPGEGSVAEGGLSKFDTTFVYDGDGHTIETNALVTAFGALLGAEPFVVTYACGAEGGADGLVPPMEEADWTTVAPTFTNAGEYMVWYCVASANYEPYVHVAKVTISKRAMDAVEATTTGSFVYTGAAITPQVEVRDGTPSIVKDSDYTASFSDNILPGTAQIVLTATETGNYTGTKTVPFTIAPAAIQLVADGATGEYCGLGYGITVNVSKPTSGYTVKYAESAEGPWLDALEYVDVCDEKPIYYQVSATGYATATGSANVTITPKELTNDEIWLVLPPEDYVYDGEAKAPEVAAYDGDPSIITDDDWEVSFTDNVNAGTATATFTGKGNYFGECFEEFEILKAENAWTTEPAVADWTYDQTPSMPVSAAVVGTATVTWSTGERPTLPGSYTATFTVPESDNYNALTKTVAFAIHPATINLVVDGATGEYCGLGYGISVNVSTPATGYTVKYAESAEGPWLDALEYVDVCDEKPIYYQVSATGYATATGSANVTIMPKELTNDEIWLVLPPEDYVYDGEAKEPEVAAYDGDPSIITDDDWEVSFSDNMNAGTATATFTGKGNYFGECTEEFEILPRAVTLTSADGSWTYDGAAHANRSVSVTVGSFLDGEGVTTNGFATITNVGETPNTFSYAFIEGTKPENYEVSCETGTLVVRKAALSPETDPDPRDPSIDPDDPDDVVDPTVRFSVFDHVGVYDGVAHTIDTNALVQAYADLFLGNEPVFSYALTSNGLYQAEAFAFTDVVATSFWYKVRAGNFDEVVHPCKVVITNRPVTVSVVGHTATVTYDTAGHSVDGYGATCEDELYDIETMTSFSGTSTAARTDVGTTPMGLAAAQFANTDSNFDVSYEIVDGGITVEPCVIGADPAKWDIRLDKAPMYNGAEQTAPIIQVCYVKPDGNLDNIPYELAGHTATDAGNYTVRITGTGNYTGTVEKDWAIVPRNVKLASGSAVWEYDGITHAETSVTVTGDGFVGEEGATYADFPQITHVADAAAETPNTFTYTLKPNTKAQNYEITTADGTVQMTKRPIELTAPTKSKPYDGTALTFTAAEIGAKYLGAEGTPAMAGSETFSFSNFASITEAGQTAATFTIADGTARMDDYAITVTAGATLTVQKSATEIAVTAKSGSWTYDGAAHQLHEYEATNLSTLLAGDTLEVAFDEASVVTTPIDGPEQNGVVANTITSVRVIRNGADDVTANYTLAWYPGTLAVTKRPVTLTSKSDSKAYDGTALTAHEVTVGGDGFVGADGAAYSFTGTQTEKGTSDNTFTYTLNEGTEAAFYAITTENGTLEVTAADITDATDDDWQVVLGPALTYTGLAQVQTIASATFRGLPLDYSVSGNQQTDAGGYEMTLTGQGNFSGTHMVAWSIAPKALTLTAGGGSKVYDGAALTVGTVTAEGFVAGEGATYTCDGSQTGVGSSANAVATINWNANTKGSNYAVTKVPGTLAVTPRPVTVTSKDISKPYDGTPLALTSADISAANVVPGESFVYSGFASRTEAGQTSATFAYAAGTGTDLANYAVTPVYGTITIAKSAAEIGVTAASASWIYDGEAHSNRTYTATNLSTLQAGDELVVTFDETSVVTTPVDGENQDGVVENKIVSVRVVRTASGQQQDVTANYTVAAYPGTLTVTKRPVAVTVVGHVATNTYDAVEHAVSGYEIVTEDELYDIAADTMFAGTASAKGTDAGTYAMNLAADQFANGNENFDVTYAVTDGALVVEAADMTDAGEDDFVLTLGENPVYNGTVQTIPVTAVAYKGLPVTYTLAGENATHAGTYTLTVKANGNFAGEKSTTWQILKRSVTLTSGSASRVYDATPLQNAAVSVSGDGFIGLEGATYAVTGAQTDVGSSKNAFTYTLKAGTLAGDYEIATVQGDLSVTPRAVTLLSASASKVYDATPLVKDAVSVKPGSLGFAGSEGFAATCSGTITAVGTTPNAFTYTLANGAKAGNYAITAEYGTLAVTKATLDAGSVFPGLETWTAENGFDCTRVYNGKAQPFEVEVSADFAEEYEFLYAVTPGAWTDVAPTRKDVSEGSLKVYFRFLSPNFEPYEGFGTLRVVEKEITDEMVQPGEDAFFYDGNEKKPTVEVMHEVGGRNICTASDYTLVYGEKADAGWWVTVTGKGNYSGTVTKIVPVLKRPVTPPVVPTRAYNGKTQKPTISTDSRWTVVANPGGIDVGEYTNVVLRLTDPVNYKWKGGTEEATDITLVFTVTKANNGWSRYPAMAGWEYGQTPSEPNLGQARYGTVQVAYRKAGADVSTETATRPELPGEYIARFYVEALANYIGVTRDVAFEITGTAPDDPVDPPPELPEKVTALISMAADGTPEISWTPDLSDNPRIVYTVLGKEKLSDAEWTPVTDANKPQMRFFKVRVETK